MAAAAFNEDAQADRILLFHEEFPNLLFSRWRHGDHGISPFVVGAPWGQTLSRLTYGGALLGSEAAPPPFTRGV
jgi:hypothetical protein